MQNDKFNVGYDFKRYGLILPETVKDKLIIDGYKAAENCSKKKADMFVRKWLGIRLRSIKKGRICTITPKDIEVAFLQSKGICPVLGEKLTFGEKQGLDWSVDRIDNALGYLPGNIVIVSDFVNQVKDCRDFYGIVEKYIERCISFNNYDLWARLILFYAKKLDHDKEKVGRMLLTGCDDLLVNMLLINWIIKCKGKPKSVFFIKLKNVLNFQKFYKHLLKAIVKHTNRWSSECKDEIIYNAISKECALTNFYNSLGLAARKDADVFGLDFYKIYFDSFHLPKIKAQVDFLNEKTAFGR